MILRCGNNEETINDSAIVKDLSTKKTKTLCDEIARSLTDAENHTKEKHCTTEAWAMANTPNACKQATAECMAAPDEELDNIDIEKSAVYTSWYDECASSFITDSIAYTVSSKAQRTD